MTLSMTDSIILGLLVLFFLVGFLKGFLRTLLGPISLFLALLLSIIIQNKTHNYLYAAITGLVGPFIIQIILSMIFKTWNSSADHKEKPSFISRLAGGILNTTWISFFIILFFLLINVLPAKWRSAAPIKQQIESSYSYTLMQKLLHNKKVNIKEINFNGIADAMNNPQKKKIIEESAEYKKIMQNDKIKNITNDPELVKMMQEKNYLGLLRSRKIQDIMKDNDLIDNILLLQKKIMSSTMKSGSAPSPNNPAQSSPPKTIRLENGVYTNH